MTLRWMAQHRREERPKPWKVWNLRARQLIRCCRAALSQARRCSKFIAFESEG